MGAPSFHDMFSLLNDSLKELGNKFKDGGKDFNDGDREIGIPVGDFLGGDKGFKDGGREIGLPTPVGGDKSFNDPNTEPTPEYNPLFDPNLADKSNKFLEDYITETGDINDDILSSIAYDEYGGFFDNDMFRNAALNDEGNLYSEWEFVEGKNIKFDRGSTFDSANIDILQPDGTWKTYKHSDADELKQLYGLDLWGLGDPNEANGWREQVSSGLSGPRYEATPEGQARRDKLLKEMSKAVLAGGDAGFQNISEKKWQSNFWKSVLSEKGLSGLLDDIKKGGDDEVYKKFLDAIGGTEGYKSKMQGLVDESILNLETGVSDRAAGAAANNQINTGAGSGNNNSILNKGYFDDEEGLYEN